MNATGFTTVTWDGKYLVDPDGTINAKVLCDILDYLFNCTVKDASIPKPHYHMDTGGWISVKERLPVTSGVYIVYAPSCDPEMPFIYVAWYDSDFAEWGLIPIHWANAITHWFPLPKPPKGVS